MKFSLKIFLSTVLIIAVSFCIGGTILISSNFENAKTARVERAISEHYTMRYFLETELVIEVAKGNKINNDTLARMAKATAAKLSWNDQSICITTTDMQEIYTNMTNGILATDIQKTLSDETTSTILKTDEAYIMLVSSISAVDNLSFYLTAASDVSTLFFERDRQIREFFVISLVTSLIGSIALFAVAGLLTRPISRLSKAAKRLTNGAYEERVQVMGNDEVSELSSSFNQMAEAVEDNVSRLTDYAKSRDDFVSNFSHELKTPMTSIMGYADILRAQKCDEETTIESASYIFNEAKRLEELALKLLKLMKLRQTQVQLTSCDLLPILEQTFEIALPICKRSGVSLLLTADSAQILCEPSLLQTLILNLIDNARKACTEGGRIEITTSINNDKIAISILDNGCGIAADELTKINEPFYMIDKSRNRKKDNGAGLGLSICTEIVRLHNTELILKSTSALGTTATFELLRGEPDEK